MKKITLFILLFSLFNYTYSQCPPNGIERTSVISNNDGFLQTITTNLYTDEYVTISGILNTDEYEFVSTHLDGIHDFITITDESNVPIDYGMSPLIINTINQATIRVHIRANEACDVDIPSHTLTLVDLTVAPTTCQKPTVSTTTTLTYRSDKRMDITWFAPEYSTPEGYEWMFVPQGGGTSFSGSTVAPNTSISTGDVLMPNTTYDISIRSTCGVNGVSDYTTFSIKTNVNSPPPNDFCSGAINLIEQTGVTDAASATPTQGTLLGGAGTDVVAESCGGSTGNARDDVWYKFVAQTTNAHITVEPNPNFDVVVTLYSGNCNSLSYLACSDVNISSPSSEEIYYSGLTIGHTYYTRTYYYGSSTPSTTTFNIKIWTSGTASDADGDGYVTAVDCDDNNANIYPGATELTGNGIDENCDDMYTWYQDSDLDSYGSNVVVQSANASPGSGESSNSLDCDDSQSNINPDTVWYLDADGDNYAVSTMTQCASPGAGYTTTVLPLTDCDDSQSSINPDTVWYLDADGDNYAVSTMTQCASPGAGYTTTVLPLTDCDDSQASINPDTVWYLDADGDNFAISTTTQCSNPGAGYTITVLPLTDCNDSDSNINPNTVWYLDADGDNFAISTTTQCSSPGAGYTTTVLPLTDCNDSDSNINPGATEIWYDGVDQNCDGQSDYDQDGDGYESESFGGNDCDDTRFEVNPGQTEIEGNGLDDDCNPSTSDNPLSVDEFNLENVKINPNPFKQFINIQLPLGNSNDNFNISLYDLNGREIFRRNVFSSNGSITIDHLSVLQQGMYFIKITNKEGNKNVVRELIKY